MQDNILASLTSSSRKNDFTSRFEELKNLQSAQAEPQKPNIGEFQRLADAMQKNPDTKMWSWVTSQPDVEEKEKTVMLAFNSYLFEMAKGQFSNWCKENNLPYVTDYVDTAISKCKDYVTPEDEFKKERDRYENRISDLEGKIATILSAKEKEVII